jgi:2,3-dihydroxybenzoate decarboxylase
VKRIAVEEHYSTQDYKDYISREISMPQMPSAPAGPEMLKLDDHGDLSHLDLRLKDMDEAGIDMQVLSISNPGVEVFEPSEAITWARKINDELAQVVAKYPERFAGYAKIPWQEPPAAVQELERAVKELGLKGVKIDSHIKGDYLDNQKYWPIFEKAAGLDVPIHIHPRELPPDMEKPYLAYPGLDGAPWGYAAEVGLHAMRLIFSGLFDELPRLKIVLGHMGEGLPFWLWRMDKHAQMPAAARNYRKKPSDYVKSNFMVATSGNFSLAALMCTYLALGAESILFGVDYPPESSVEAVQFMEAAPICPGDKEKIYHRNAEELFKL